MTTQKYSWHDLRDRFLSAQSGLLSSADIERLTGDLRDFVLENSGSVDANEATKAIEQLRSGVKPISIIDEKADHGKQFNAIKILLTSPLPHDVHNGFTQLRKQLQQNLENREIYNLLLQVAQEKPALREDIKNLFETMAQRNSRSAIVALRNLDGQTSTGKEQKKQPLLEENGNSSLSSLMAEADDAYYAGEYDKAIKLYQQVSRLDPGNERARGQLEKADLNRIASKPSNDLPRDATQYFRRARSFIAAKDYNAAISMLEAAIEVARGAGKSFPDAESLLEAQETWSVASQYRKEADAAIKEERWEDALQNYQRVLNLDPTDTVAKSVFDSLQKLLQAQSIFDLLDINPSDMEYQQQKLQSIDKTIKEVLDSSERTQPLHTSTIYRRVVAQAGLYKTEERLREIRGIYKILNTDIFNNADESIQRSKGVAGVSSTPVFKRVESQVQLWRQQKKNFARAIIALVLSVLVIIFLMFAYQSYHERQLALTPSSTPTATNTATLTPVPTSTITLTPTSTYMPTSTPTITPTATPSFTLTPSELGLSTAYQYVYDKPSGKQIGFIDQYVSVLILETAVDGGVTWYKCRWTFKDVTQEGWIKQLIQPVSTP